MQTILVSRGTEESVDIANFNVSFQPYSSDNGIPNSHGGGLMAIVSPTRFKESVLAVRGLELLLHSSLPTAKSSPTIILTPLT